MRPTLESGRSCAGSYEYESLLREYERLAPRYEERWKFYVEAAIRETLRRLGARPGDRVMDVGCGTGALLNRVSLLVPGARLAGVELSPAMLEIALGRLGGSADLRQGRAEDLPFGEAAFDIVVSTNVFHFIRHPVEALREMSRVLRPSGRLVLTDWCDDYLGCRVCDLFLRALKPAHYRTYGSAECCAVLEGAGFGAVRVERYKISWLWGLMTAVGEKPPAGQETGPTMERGAVQGRA